MKKTDLIISVSSHSKEHMQKIGVKSTVIYNPMDLKKFENAKRKKSD
jgi:hypothetical protein